jgi:peptidoglycan/LPS O-acetylase OafA/YrhL
MSKSVSFLRRLRHRRLEMPTLRTSTLASLFFGQNCIKDFDGSRSNNFTLIRLILASLVLFGHSFPLTKNPPDPITQFTGVWIGDVAVNSFFALSGFLVAGSFVQNGALRYVFLRAIRIYPALFVCIILSVLVGSTITTLPISEYFRSPITWAYIKLNLTFTSAWYLPGVFESNPYDANVNGSIWTLPAEVRSYVIVLFAGVLGVLDNRMRINVAAFGALLMIQGSTFPLIEPLYVRPFAFFVLGVIFWANRDIVRLSPFIAILAFFAIVISQKYFPAEKLFAVCLVYLLFFIVYAIKHIDLDRFGDISYGVYIYAWPVQQYLWRDGQTGYDNFILAAPVTFALAIGSWFLIEKPALSVAKRFKRSTK